LAEIGFTLSSEEHGPRELVEQAVAAESVGFSFASVSDHFHPWTDRQGNAPFVWAVIGAVLQATERIPLITGVTCPTVRIHPAIIAQAAATVSCLAPGRFSLGLGSGENLNEHILGDRWPSVKIRQEMLEEAIEVIRKLWTGGLSSHRGRHYEVENARLYTLPDELPPVLVASAGEAATDLAARVGDGLVGLAPAPAMIDQFASGGGEGKPCYGQVHVCWAESEEQARKTALERWPNGGLPGKLFVELPLPSHFEEAADLVTESAIAEAVVCGPDPQLHIEAIQEFLDAGFSHVFVHQIGPHGREFFDFYGREVLPGLMP
jgi:G6PDH family F420-dependent oxidoreductase